MGLNISIAETNIEIQKKIRTAVFTKINKSFTKSIPKLEIAIANIIGDAIESSEEYISLVSGRLRYEFGIADALSRMGTVIDVWKGSLRLLFKPFTDKGVGGITITAIRSDYSDIINIPSAVLKTPDYSIPWLKWLLLEGDSVIINDYHIRYGNFDRSRTGGALMFEGGQWRVPYQYSGIQDNNFVTRSLDKANQSIQSIIIKEITNNI